LELRPLDDCRPNCVEAPRLFCWPIHVGRRRGCLRLHEVPASEVLDIVSSLLDKSLVIKDEVGGIACYRLHETMREYAALQTNEADEEDLLADRYIDYYRTTCLSAAAGARFRLADWLPWAEVDPDNIR